jgi:hypothetical protein
MDNDRERKFPCQPDEAAEHPFLVALGRAVSVKIEADLADSDNLRVAGCQFPDEVEAFLRDPDRVVGMDADGTEDMVMVQGKFDCGAARFQVGPYRDDAGKAGFAGAFKHVVEIGQEIPAVYMGVGVDEVAIHGASFDDYLIRLTLLSGNRGGQA